MSRRIRVLVVDVDRRTERNQVLAAAGCEPATLVAEFTSPGTGHTAYNFTLPATSDASEQHQYQIRIEVID